MKLLAIDTSTDVCSVCIIDSQSFVADYVSKSSKTHSERLLPAIELLFSQLSFSLTDIDGLAVIHGPGSFTGLRISLSVVKGLAFALNRPVVAMNALEVAASQIDQDGWICPAMDARRGEIFTGLFRREKGEMVTVVGPKSVSPLKWKEELPAERIHFCGPGAALYFDTLKTEGSTIHFADFVLARSLGKLALRKLEAGDVVTGAQVHAAYLRPSDAEVSGPRPRKTSKPAENLKLL